MSKTIPNVFISYAHEGDLQRRVKELAEWLTGKGVQVITDHPYSNRPPEKGWRAWMQHNVEDADIVLIVCTERYKNLFEKREIPDEGGRGVTWESAIITDDLYHSKLLNQRFFPILPDDGNHDHVPRVLSDWNNGHKFPSGNDGILSLIRDEIVVPKPEVIFQQKLPGELVGSDDPRLLPISGEVIGRTEELDQVSAFLHSTVTSISVSGHVTGSGGIGKTEVCKAALKQLLIEHPDQRVFYVTVSDTADTQMLLVHLGEAIGLSIDTLGQIQTLAQLRPYLTSGLYYLDNLEHVAESSGGVALIRSLMQVSGTRWLASSRVTLDHIFGKSITVGRLDEHSALRLFMHLWNGEFLSSEEEVSSFVDEELGGHPLSITLLARLGRSYSWEVLQERWKQQGTALAKTRKASGRMDSLEISFALTCQLLKQEPGALQLWQFASLFPDGLSEQTLQQWETISGFNDARISLIEHHILESNQNWFSLLPPVSRYALENVEPYHLDQTGFDWESTRELSYRYFISVAEAGSAIVSSKENTNSKIRISQEMWAIDRLLSMSSNTDSSSIRELHHLLVNTYQFNSIASRNVLSHTKQLLKDGHSSKYLADLESRLGQIDEARAHYDEAIQLYQQEQAKLGLANVLQSQGDLLLSGSEYENALNIYNQASEIYNSERDSMGLAYTLAEIIKCNYYLNCQENQKSLAIEAINAAQASGVPQVEQYVIRSLYEVCGESEEDLQFFLESLSTNS